MLVITKTDRVPKPKRVTLVLEASARSRNAMGADIYSQILWMRLDGLTVDQIAKALGCDEELVTDAINCWQSQVEIREGETFRPRRRNPRRWNNRPAALRVAA